MRDPIYSAPAPLVDEQYEAIMCESMPLPEDLAAQPSPASPDTEGGAEG